MSDFYSERALPTPSSIQTPSSLDELRAMAFEPEHAPVVFVGGGEHIHSGSIGLDHFTVIETKKLNRLIDFDSTSMIAHVESGITWSSLRDVLSARGASMSFYGLNPSGATIGGLLARRAVHTRTLFDGDILDGLVSVDALTSSENAYHCLPAPRKSSGPDMRYMFVGSQGAYGPILSARLIAWPKMPGRLFVLNAPTLSDILLLWPRIVATGVRLAWSWWDDQRQKLLLAAYWPEVLSEQLSSLLMNQFYPIIDEQDDQALTLIQDALEREHPAARSGQFAERTWAMSLPWSEVETHKDALEDTFDQIIVTKLTQQGVVLYGVLPPAVQTVPGWLKRCARAISPVVDQHSTTWSTEDQQLKDHFDPTHQFAVGP